MGRATGMIIEEAIKFANADAVKALGIERVINASLGEGVPDETLPQELYDRTYMAHIVGAITCLERLLAETKQGKADNFVCKQEGQ